MKCSLLLAVLLTGLAACDDQQIDRTPTSLRDAAAPADEVTEDDAEAPDAALEAAAPADATPPVTAPTCTTTFGTGLSPDFGRLDGTVRIVITPGLPKCKSDDDHVIVQLDVLEGGTTRTYPVLVNILSDITVIDPAVRLAQTTHALEGPPWASGWHAGTTLDYPSSLGMHTGMFAPKTKSELASAIAAALPPGAKVSAYMAGFDTRDGGHKVHRNFTGADGALAVVGAGTPRWLLFQFSQQVF